VLRWFAYFRESVGDFCGPEQQRVRRVAIHYYLVDDTLDVCEPHQGDSGIMQARHAAAACVLCFCARGADLQTRVGPPALHSLWQKAIRSAAAHAGKCRTSVNNSDACRCCCVLLCWNVIESAPQGMFIKRHKIEKEDGGGAFRPADFAIGAAVRMYSRVMTVVDADPFTRRHMAALGIDLGDPLPYPANPTEEYRSAFGRKVAGSPCLPVICTYPESMHAC